MDVTWMCYFVNTHRDNSDKE